MTTCNMTVLRRTAAALLLASAVCLARDTLTGAAEPQGPADEVKDLSARLLANPSDADARARLGQLRQLQRQERAHALDALAAGLDAHLAGRRDAAAANLQKALPCPYAVDLANAVLLKPLEEIAKEYGVSAQPGQAPEPPTAAPAPPQGTCPKCGGLTWVDCPSTACFSTGTRRCSTCAGTGAASGGARSAAAAIRYCTKCNGTGVEPCPVCGGRGTVPCDKCSAGGGAASDSLGNMSPRALAAIRQVIVMARYLRDGGVDLYSPKALACSPVVTAGAAGGPAALPAAAPAP